jgi:hypothetical protein
VFKTKKRTLPTTITIDPIHHTYYSSQEEVLTQRYDIRAEENQETYSFLSPNSFITEVISVSKNIPEEDLFDIIETKIYDILALDMTTKYNIQYIEVYNQYNEDRLFNVFVLHPDELNSLFEKSVEKFEYIDMIIPSALLFKGLYSKGLIETSNVHCFIYIQKDDAVLTLYNNQNFIYTKSLKFTINQLHERFCELLGEQIDVTSFYSLLEHEGLSTNNSQYQKYLIQLFGELFLYIKNDLLPHATRENEIEKIDTLYFGTELGPILGLSDFSRTYLGINSKKFDFDYGFKSKQHSIDQLHQLLQLYSNEAEHKKYICNFSNYNRPPAFIKRESGRLILLIAASIIFAISYPFYFIAQSYTEDIKRNLLSSDYSSIHQQRVEREALLIGTQKKYNDLIALKDEEKNKFVVKQKTLSEVYQIKSNYPMKAKLIAELSKDLNHYKVKIVELDYNEKSKKIFTLKIQAKKHTNITRLIQYFTKEKNNSFKFTMDDITYDKTDDIYKSELKVALR